MALIDLHFYSTALGMETNVLVILPQTFTDGQIGIDAKAQDKACKTLYLLHGLSDDQTIWMRRTSIERYAAQYGICVVMPCGGRSFYCDIKNGLAYYTFIAKELPRRIREFFRVSEKREDTFAAGFSMGGYGALKLALKETDTFCAAAAISPCCDLIAAGMEGILQSIFGEAKMPQDQDIACLANLQKENPHQPRLYAAIGTHDFLYSSFQPVKKVLETNISDFTYIEQDADHNWIFADSQIQHALKWMFER